MRYAVLVVTAAAVIVGWGARSANAQQSSEAMMQQPSQQQVQLPSHDQSMGQGGMMGGGRMGRMGGGMMGGHGAMAGPLPMRIIFVLMDADGNGTVSLQEFQAAHEKIFRGMDANKDGVLTMQEMLAFMRSSRGSEDDR